MIKLHNSAELCSKDESSSRDDDETEHLEHILH